MNKLAPFTLKQRDYLVRCLDSWFSVAEGGKRGGKNVLQTMAFCICLDDHPSKIHLIAGVSTSTARLNILDCDGFGLANYFEGRCRIGQYQNRDCIYVQTRTGEKVVLVSGGGKKGSETLIKGNTYGMAYVTEANECAQTFLQEVFDRTLTSKDRKIFHDLNPKSEGHWYYTDMLNFHETQQRLNPTYGYNYGHFTIADNMSVSDEKLRKEIATYDKKTVWYQRDILGKRKQAEGLVYPDFDSTVHIVAAVDRQYDCFVVTNDYGVQHACVFGLWGRCKSVWYLISTSYHHGEKEGQRTVNENYDALMQLVGNRRIHKFFLDNAPIASSFNVHVYRTWTSGGIRLADNKVLAGIQDVSTALKKGLVLFNSSNKEVVSEFGLYSWDPKGVSDEKPLKINDDCMDMVRYFVRSMRIARPARAR